MHHFSHHHHDAMQPRQKSNIFQPGHVTFSLQFHAKILSTHWLCPTSEAQHSPAQHQPAAATSAQDLSMLTQYRAGDCLLTSSSVTYSLSECTSLMYYWETLESWLSIFCLEIMFFVHCGNRKLRGNCMFGLGRSYKFLLALIIRYYHNSSTESIFYNTYIFKSPYSRYDTPKRNGDDKANSEGVQV